MVSLTSRKYRNVKSSVLNHSGWHKFHNSQAGPWYTRAVHRKWLIIKENAFWHIKKGVKKMAFTSTSAATSCLVCLNNTCHVPSNQTEYCGHNRAPNHLCNAHLMQCWHPATMIYASQSLDCKILQKRPLNATSSNWPLWARMSNKAGVRLFLSSQSLSQSPGTHLISVY